MDKYMYTEDSPGTLTAEEFVAALVSDEPICIAHATITGRVEFVARDCRELVDLRDVTFVDYVNLGDSRFSKSVELRHCQFQAGFSATNIRIDGDFVVQTSKFDNEPGERFAISLRNSIVEGNVLAPGLVHGAMQTSLACRFRDALSCRRRVSSRR